MIISKEIESKIKPSITKNQMASLGNPTEHLTNNQHHNASHSAQKTDKKGKVPNSFGEDNTSITWESDIDATRTYKPRQTTENKDIELLLPMIRMALL